MALEDGITASTAVVRKLLIILVDSGPALPLTPPPPPPLTPPPPPPLPLLPPSLGLTPLMAECGHKQSGLSISLVLSVSGRVALKGFQEEVYNN